MEKGLYIVKKKFPVIIFVKEDGSLYQVRMKRHCVPTGSELRTFEFYLNGAIAIDSSYEEVNVQEMINKALKEHEVEHVMTYEFDFKDEHIIFNWKDNDLEVIYKPL